MGPGYASRRVPASPGWLIPRYQPSLPHLADVGSLTILSLPGLPQPGGQSVAGHLPRAGARSTGTLRVALGLPCDRLQEALMRGDRDGLRPGVHAQLIEERGDMRLHGALSHGELMPDLLVGEPFRNQAKHFLLARTQHCLPAPVSTGCPLGALGTRAALSNLV